MKKTYEILNNGAFVVTKNEQGELLLGYYHDVFSQDTIERLFEPIAPIGFFTTEQIMQYIENAE